LPIDLLKFRHSGVPLQFEEIVVCPKNLFEPAHCFTRLVQLSLSHIGWDLARKAGAQADQPVSMLGQQLAIHTRTVVEPVQVGDRDQFEEVLVAGRVFGQQNQVKSFGV
jgi:hypothetical protein